MVTYLNSEHLSAIETLQATALDKLKTEGHGHFIIPRSPHYFTRHLQAPHAMAGIFDGDQLIAQAVFHLQEFDVADYTRMPALPGQKPDAKVAVMKGVLVHPDYQGRGYFSALITEFLSWAQGHGLQHALSRIATDNAASLRVFEKNGFQVVNTITDARDDAHVHVMHKNI